MSQQSNEFVDELEKLLLAADLSDHPFLKHFGSAMTEAQLRTFAIHWSKMTQRTGGLASALLANLAEHFWETPDLAMREKLAGEVVDEETGIACGSQSHCRLAIKFAESLGVSRDELFETAPLPEVVSYTDWAFDICKNEHYLLALGGIGGTEYMNPAVMRTVVSALKHRFHKNEADYEFFTVHIAGDEEHGGIALKALGQYATDDGKRQKARQATIDGANHFHGVMDGLYRVCTV